MEEAKDKLLTNIIGEDKSDTLKNALEKTKKSAKSFSFKKINEEVLNKNKELRKNIPMYENNEPALGNKAGWIIQLVFGFGFILILVIAIVKLIKWLLWMAILFYLIYLIFNLLAPRFRYLWQNRKARTVFLKIRQLIKAKPTITFTATCYHLDKEKKIISHYDKKVLPIYSSRDVSGLFKLDIPKEEISQKYYIKLDMKQCIDWADEISYLDYIKAKREFWENNRYRDIHMEFKEERNIPGFTDYELVLIRDKEPLSVKVPYFLLFTFLPCAQFYRKYVEKYYITKEYKLRKLISTRNDLKDDKFNAKYANMNPAIDLGEETFTFQNITESKDEEAIEVKENKKEPTEPTKEELKEAEIYKEYIPEYEVGVVDENLHSGIVLDCTDFEDVDYSVPPPGFERLGEKVKIPQKKLRQEGNNGGLLNGEGPSLGDVVGGAITEIKGSIENTIKDKVSKTVQGAVDSAVNKATNSLTNNVELGNLNK
ncbi:MAG: hypothetical protein MJ252_15405 [archaeon]|nr:hypothetical protein [archaeon]